MEDADMDVDEDMGVYASTAHRRRQYFQPASRPDFDPSRADDKDRDEDDSDSEGFAAMDSDEEDSSQQRKRSQRNQDDPGHFRRRGRFGAESDDETSDSEVERADDFEAFERRRRGKNSASTARTGGIKRVQFQLSSKTNAEEAKPEEGEGEINDDSPAPLGLGFSSDDFSSTPTVQDASSVSALLPGASTMAAKYLAKFGFKGRLGLHEQGIAAPIEVKARPEGAGLGTIREASSLPENIQNTKYLESLRANAVAREAKARAQLLEKQEAKLRWRKPLTIPNAWDDVELEETSDWTTDRLDDLVRESTQAAQRAEQSEQTARSALKLAQSLKQRSMAESDAAKRESAAVERRAAALRDLLRVALEPLAVAIRSGAHTEIEPLMKTLAAKLREHGVEESEYKLSSELADAWVEEAAATRWSRGEECVSLIESLVRWIPEALPRWREHHMAQGLRMSVISRLKKDADAWIESVRRDRFPLAAPLHWIALPWLGVFEHDTKSLLRVASSAMEGAAQVWPLSRSKEAASAMEPWCSKTPPLLSPVDVVECFTKRLAPRFLDALEGRRDEVETASVVADLLSWRRWGLIRESFVCHVLEVGLFVPGLTAIRAVLRDGRRVERAAKLYANLAGLVPPDLLKGNSLRTEPGVRLRCHLDLALEEIRCAMDGVADVDPSILIASEPWPSTLQQAFDDYQSGYPASFEPSRVASVPRPSLDTSSRTEHARGVREELESFAIKNGVHFVADPYNRSVKGARVYLFGNLQVCFVDRRACRVEGGELIPTSFEDLLQASV